MVSLLLCGIVPLSSFYLPTIIQGQLVIPSILFFHFPFKFIYFSFFKMCGLSVAFLLNCSRASHYSLVIQMLVLRFVSSQILLLLLSICSYPSLGSIECYLQDTGVSCK